MSEVLSRSEAIAAIQRYLGNTEEAAHVIDWTCEMWETMDELHKRLSPARAHKIIHAHMPTFDEVLAARE